MLGLLRMVLRGQGLFSELLLQKDGGMMVGRINDTRTCEDMEVRVCKGGGQSRKRGCGTGYGTGQVWVLYSIRRRQDLEYVVRVCECGCKNLGEDGRLCTVLLGRVASATMAQDCVGVVDLSVAGVQWCIQRPSIVWG